VKTGRGDDLRLERLDGSVGLGHGGKEGGSPLFAVCVSLSIDGLVGALEPHEFPARRVKRFQLRDRFWEVDAGQNLRHLRPTVVLHRRIALERRLLAWHRQDQDSQRLATIPGVGLISATAFAASVPNPSLFRSGREFAAFLGLVPRQNSSGGKDRLGRISRMGDGYLRKLLVVGATSVIRRARSGTLAAAPWIKSLLERRPARVVTIAMANRPPGSSGLRWLAATSTGHRRPPDQKSQRPEAAAPDCRGARGLMMI